MGEVVNLRLQRKRAARRAAEASAEESRIAHGLPKAVRELAEKRSAQETTRLDGHRLISRAPSAREEADRGEAAGAGPFSGSLAKADEP